MGDSGAATVEGMHKFPHLLRDNKIIFLLLDVGAKLVLGIQQSLIIDRGDLIDVVVL